MKVKLITATPDAEKIIGYVARVSSPQNQDNPNVEKLLKYCAKYGHWSVFETASATFEIETSIAISMQILRHRSAKYQQFCVSGDTKVTTETVSGRTKKVKIEDLWKRYNSNQYWDMSDKLVRVFDESSKSFVKSPIKEIFKTGRKPCWKVSLEGGKSIIATQDHKILTFEGWKRLGDLQKSSDFVAVNGVAHHQNREWLQSAKQLSIETGEGVPLMAEMADVSYHTIRKWLRKHSLQFSPQEIAKVTDVWNKGLPSDQQPRYGKSDSLETRYKKSIKSLARDTNPLYVNGNSKNRGWRQRVWDFGYKYKQYLAVKQGWKCAISGVPLTMETLEVDHIIPVNMRPDLAFDVDNLQAVEKSAHRAKSNVEAVASRHTVSYKPIVAIDYIGEVDTYDLEVEHPSHNYIAGGIVVHNSGRYSTFSDEGVEIYTARRQDTKNRQNSIDDLPYEVILEWRERQKAVFDMAYDNYEWALQQGIAKECARMVLPLNTKTKMYMTADFRTWIHYLALRSGNGSQKEHMDIANAIIDVFKTEFPLTHSLIQYTKRSQELLQQIMKEVEV